MGAENEIGMAGEPAIDADGAFVIRRRANLVNVEPVWSLRLTGLALAKEENVDDDIRAGVLAKAALGSRIAATRSADLAICSRAVVSALSIVPCEVTKTASAPGFSKSIDRAMK